MADTTPTQRKLIAYLKKRDPKLSEKEILSLLGDFKRFVDVTWRIYKEPQARVSFRDRIVDEKVVKDRIFTTNMEEISKVMVSKVQPLEEVLRKFNKSVTKDKDEK